MDEKSSNKEKVFKGISSQTIVTIVLGVVEVFSFSIMSRLLTKEDFGYYAAIMAIVTIFASFSETGIGSAIIQRKEVDSNFVNNAFTLSVLFGISISSLLFVCSELLANMVSDISMAKPLKIMSITLFANCLTSIFTSIMQRRLDFLKIGAINLFALIVTTIVAIWLACMGQGHYAIIAKAALQSIIICIISFHFCKTKFRLALNKKNTASIFQFSGWLMASVVFRNIAHQVDRLLIPRLLSIEALGAYNRPQDFINQISTKLNGIFDMTLFPILSSIQDEKTKLRKAFCDSLYFLNLFAVFLTVAFVFNSSLIIRLFFGEQWLELKSIMMVLSFMLVFSTDGRLADCYLRSMGMTKAQFYFRIIETIINILGVLIGFRWGTIGIAISLVLSNSISKLSKIIFIGLHMDISILCIFKILFSSWRFVIIIVPLFIISQKCFPQNVWGDLIGLSSFISITILVFLAFPSIVGERYKQSVHKIIFKKIEVILNH